MPNETAVEQYTHAATYAERRRLGAEVIVTYRGHVAALVRRLLRDPSQWRDGEQAGAIGLLVALERFRPEPTHDENAFWGFAKLLVANEIENWLDVGVRWRPASRNRVRDERADADGEARRLHARPATLDGVAESMPSQHDTPEDMTAEAQITARLRSFLLSLPAVDRLLLLVEKRNRDEGGVSAGNNARSRRYLGLVERAKAFVRGQDDEQPTAVR